VPAARPPYAYFQAPIEDVYPEPAISRASRFDDGALDELAASIQARTA
jgi:hypothetical protein